MKKKYTGFTLVELLVVIAIITLLLSVGLIAYQHILKEGRDAKRLSDLKTLQSALEQYFADQKYYPSSVSFSGATATSLTGGGKTYLNIVPNDPSYPTITYQYRPFTSAGAACTVSTQCAKFCIYANLENITGTDFAPGCPTIGSGYDYSVTSP